MFRYVYYFYIVLLVGDKRILYMNLYLELKVYISGGFRVDYKIKGCKVYEVFGFE